ncbi:MAG: hypothetical protein JO317_02050, partial [Verrucomicrobiae bacterium]|nr:hypothetical protein [Verrucomicrobiae bacterium]
MDIAPDLGSKSLPINHARLLWFVSAHELNRNAAPSIDEISLGRMLDEDVSTATVFTKPQRYEMVFDLQRTVQMDRIALVLNSPGLPVQIRVSDSDLSRRDGRGWTEAGETESQVPVTNVEFRPQPVRFVHLTIDASKISPDRPLKVYEFRIFGEEDMRDYALVPTPSGEMTDRRQVIASNSGIYPPEMLEPDLASLTSGGRILYASSVRKNKNVSLIIDDDPDTRWIADPEEKETLVVIDLGAERKIKKVSLLHSMRAGEMLVYLSNSLPGKPGPAATLAWLGGVFDTPLFQLAAHESAGRDAQPPVTSEWLGQQEPFGRIDTTDSIFSETTGSTRNARYVILRYLNRGGRDDLPLMINVVNVLGDYKPEDFVLAPRGLPAIASGGSLGAPVPSSTPLGVPPGDI